MQDKVSFNSEVLSDIAKTLVSAINVTTDNEIEKRNNIEDIRAAANQNNSDLITEYIVKAIDSDTNGNLDNILADKVFQTFCVKDIEGDSYTDNFWKNMQGIAERLPDSSCAQVMKVATDYKELNMEKSRIQDQYQDDMTGSDFDKQQEIQAEYKQDITEINQKIDGKAAEIQDLYCALQEVLGKEPVVITSEEKEIISTVLRVDSGEYNDLDGSTYEKCEKYVDSHPNSLVSEFYTAREEFYTALGNKDGSVSEDEVQEKYDNYNRISHMIEYVVVDDSVAVDKTNDIENEDAESKSVTNETDDTNETDTDNATKNDTTADVEPKEINPKEVEGKETSTEEKADVEVQIQSHQKVEVEDYKDCKIGIREDAKAVVDYGAALGIYGQKDRYDGFGNNGEDLIESVNVAWDAIEKYAKDNAPLSKELNEVLYKLDELGEKNGDVQHDKEVDSYNDLRKEIILNAGAIDWSTISAKDEDIGDRIVDYSSSFRLLINCSPDNPEYNGYAAEVSSCLDDIKKASNDNKLASDYNELINKYSLIKTDISKLKNNLSAATTDEDKKRISHEIETKNHELSNCQRLKDVITFKIEIDREGRKEYDFYPLPEEKVTVDENGGIEPVIATPLDIPTQDDIEEVKRAAMTPYDISKEDYKEIRDKYSIRNSFVAVDKLSFDLEAYKAGKEGSRGHVVSGGDIAIDVFEVMRTNIIDSALEVAIRNIADSLYPAKETAVDISEPQISVMYRHVDYSKIDTNITKNQFDNGWIDPSAKNIDTETKNPGYGNYLGFDMKQDPVFVQGNMVAYELKDSVYAANYKDEVTDKIETAGIPLVKLVTIGDGRYLVDACGKTFWSNVVAEDRHGDKGNKVSLPYFEQLDISKSVVGRDTIKAIADTEGISVDDYKGRLTEMAKEALVSTNLKDFESHSKYLKDTLIPESKDVIKECKTREQGLQDVYNKINDRIANPKEGDDVDKMRDVVTVIENKITSVKDIEKTFENRVKDLEGTVKNYKDAAQGCQKVDDTNLKFKFVVYPALDARGKIDYPKLNINGVDRNVVKSVDYVCRTLDVGKELGLSKSLISFDLGEQPNVSMNSLGVLQQDEHDPLEETIKEIFGVKDGQDRVSPVDKNYVVNLLKDIGVSSPTIDKNIEKEEPNKDVEKDKDKNSETTVENPSKENQDTDVKENKVDENKLQAFLDAIPFVQPLDSVPTKEQIMDARDSIQAFGDKVTTTDGFGLREYVDGIKLEPGEIVRYDEIHFYFIPEGYDNPVIADIKETVACTNGKLSQEDVSEAIDKYLGIADKPDSTYSFSQDFLAENKYRVTPEMVLDAYKEKLQDFFSDTGKENISEKKIEMLADCLASAKEQIVSSYLESVVDKIEVIISDAIEKGDNSRVEAFVNAIEKSFEPVVKLGIAVDDKQASISDSIIGRLSALESKGVEASSLNTILDKAKILDSQFNGVSQTLKDISSKIEAYTSPDTKDSVVKEVSEKVKDIEAVIAAIVSDIENVKDFDVVEEDTDTQDISADEQDNNNDTDINPNTNVDNDNDNNNNDNNNDTDNDSNMDVDNQDDTFIANFTDDYDDYDDFEK